MTLASHGASLITMRTVQAALSAARTDKSIMSKNMKKTEAILREMVGLTLRTDLTKIQRTNLETCITVHMHQKVRYRGKEVTILNIVWQACWPCPWKRRVTAT